MSNDDLPDDERTPYERFRDLARQVLTLPPEEVTRRQEEWKEERKKRKGKSSKNQMKPDDGPPKP